MFRSVSLGFLTLVASLALFLTPAFAARSFPETGYSITNNKFQDYFEHRGGARVLGFPVSREFDFMGGRVQFFQRAVLQQSPDGGVALLNILDGGLMPYTHINGSTFPAPDPSVIGGAPNPPDPAYADKALAFVQANAPDGWLGMSTNFYKTFASTVAMQDAFPNGDGNDGLLALINLEIWGLPTSKPTIDPANNNFVYLRFQRGIMHFDKTTGLTQGILLADYMKSLITGQNLPGDLAAEASSSPLLQQYNNGMANGLNRPAALPATNMFAAFEKDGVVVPPPTAPAPAPAPTPAPTPVPASVPAPTSQQPATITVTGDDFFVEQTTKALDLLSRKANEYYINVVRKNVYRISQVNDNSNWDAANHTLNVTVAAAFPTDWRFNSDYQIEWYSGLMVHNATHIEQSLTGQPSTGLDAEIVARDRQKSTLSRVDTSPDSQLYNFLKDVVDRKEATLGDWENPRAPKITPTPTP